MAEAGRPKIKIDWASVDQMLLIQCTGEEIAGVLGIDYDTLQNHCKELKKKDFSEYSLGKREGGRASLRRKQWKLADKNASMAIFLGKNLLEQSDKQEINHEHTFPTGIEINFTGADPED